MKVLYKKQLIIFPQYKQIMCDLFDNSFKQFI